MSGLPTPVRAFVRASVLGAAVVASLAATPVPSPVHVQRGAAAVDGTVAWSPAVQRVTGPAGELIAVDLALDHGGEHVLTAAVAVRGATIDPEDGPRAAGRSDVLRIAIDRVVLEPGDRGTFRTVAEMPDRPRVVAVQARLHPDDATGPSALILLVPDRMAAGDAVTAAIELRGPATEVRVRNPSAFPRLVDVTVTARSWLGAADEVRIGDVLLPPDGHRVLEVELSRGLGRRVAAVAVAERGDATGRTVVATTAAWPPRTTWTLVAGSLTLLAGAMAVRVWRRS